MDIKQFFNGAISGMFGIMISHPIDTIKTSIQDKKKINFSLRFLYRGLLPSLSGVGLEKAIVFGTFKNMEQYMKNNNYNNNIITPISGLAAGTSAAFIVTPVERLKILSQTGQQINLNHFKLSSLYRGISATFTREIPGFSIYFSSYNYLKYKFYNDNIPLHMSFLFGGVAGTLSWCGIYPQDVIKTRMQADLDKKTFKNIVKEIYSEGGILMFYRGFHLAVLRAIPLHAGTFMMMEFIK